MENTSELLKAIKSHKKHQGPWSLPGAFEPSRVLGGACHYLVGSMPLRYEHSLEESEEREEGSSEMLQRQDYR